MPSSALDHLFASIFGPTNGPLLRQRALRLDRIERLLEILGHPQWRFLGVQIIGTSGKGSVGAMVSSILTKAGIQTGLSTKPFLISPTEHFRINDRDITPAQLKRILMAVRPVVRKVARQLGDQPTQFEILTAAGALLFAEEQVIVGIFESGLGGQYDAVTALRAPIKIITSISLDHLKSLGPTIDKIARNKAAAIRRGDIVISSADGQAERIITATCRDKAAHLIEAGTDLSSIRTNYRGTTFSWRGSTYHTNLIGPHQAINAAAALATIQCLPSFGIKTNRTTRQNGLDNVRWPGRFQIISKNPLLVLDGAHNPGKIAALIRTLDALRIPKNKLIVIYSSKDTKDARGMLCQLAPRCKSVFLPIVQHEERLIAPETLSRFVPNGQIFPSISTALRQAQKSIGKNGAIVCTGSLRLVGRVLAMRSSTP